MLYRLETKKTRGAPNKFSVVLKKKKKNQKINKYPPFFVKVNKYMQSI